MWPYACSPRRPCPMTTARRSGVQRLTKIGIGFVEKSGIALSLTHSDLTRTPGIFHCG